MLNPDHFRRFIIVPALSTLPEAMRTTAAVELLLGTALKESGLSLLKQGLRTVTDGRGRALGLYQMEPATYLDHLRWLRTQPALGALIFPHGPRPATDMQGDLYLATHLARIHYWWRGKEALPEVDDIEGMARYWGKYWQTQSIPAQMESFVSLYRDMARSARTRAARTKKEQPT